MMANLARMNRIPWDWGLEIGVLPRCIETARPRAHARWIWRTITITNIRNFRRKTLRAGLRRMSCDIAKTLFRTLAAEGVVLANGLFHSLEVRYLRMAEDTLDRYYADAMLNGLTSTVTWKRWR